MPASPQKYSPILGKRCITHFSPARNAAETLLAEGPLLEGLPLVGETGFGLGGSCHPLNLSKSARRRK